MEKKDICKTGVTVFTPPPSTSYRYVIDLKDNKLKIWMEDCSSKKQCSETNVNMSAFVRRCKGDMLKEDYVTSANTIPNASPADYVKCFYDCFDCNLNTSCPVQRTLTKLMGDKVNLELTLTIPFLRSTWVAKYSFELDPVEMDRINVMKSTIRDQYDELQRLRSELYAVKAVPFIKLAADCMDQNKQFRWNKVDCAEFVVDNENGVIKARTQGVYSIRGVINCAPSNYSQYILSQCPRHRVTGRRRSNLQIGGVNFNLRDSHESIMILKNGECIQRSYCGYTAGKCVSTPLDCVALVKEGDALTITCDCDSVSMSYLSIVAIVRN
ncbi:hypothetical protein KXD40_008919 [Peronospora effusa]|nr:hypothetical protein KXD40_008919 [Peronospora effusa]